MSKRLENSIKKCIRNHEKKIGDTIMYVSYEKKREIGFIKKKVEIIHIEKNGNN